MLSQRVPRVYAIADSQTLGLVRVTEAVRIWMDCGIRWIQLRIKAETDLALFRTVEACVKAAQSGEEIDLWVNDRADLAAMFPVYGLHLGQTDLPPKTAREIIGPEKRLGLSTHTPDQLRAADLESAVDVVAIGPVFGTQSKAAPDPAVGLGGVEEARSLTGKPLVAIGGIEVQTAPAVLASGADSVAVIGALCRGDLCKNAHKMLAAVASAASRHSEEKR